VNILIISSLYPNNKDLKHGVFVETRLRHLIKDFPDVKPIVIAPVPWFPFSSPKFGRYSNYAGVMAKETRHSIEIHHPKYLVIPKIGMYLTPLFMKWTVSRTLNKLIGQGNVFDVIDGHYFYPDGVAIAGIAKKFKLPFTCTARGTDINLIPQYPKALRMLKTVFKQSAHMMTVCQALKDEMLTLGVKDEDVTVLRNGVDLELFKPSNEIQQQVLKEELGINSKLIMSVGWLIERKGHYLVIDAIKNIDNATLVIAGNGPDQVKLEDQVKKLGLENKVIFLGAISQTTLNKWFNAADVTVLASSREGWANVLLESMASGTPVVATNVWGTPEVVTCRDAGVLIERSAKSIQQGLETLLANPPQRELTRQYAEEFDWSATSQGQLDIFTKIINNS